MALKDIGSPQIRKSVTRSFQTTNPVFRLTGVLITAIALVALISFGFWSVRSSKAQNVNLIEVSGLVEVTSRDSSSGWENVWNGQQMKEGQRIRTGDDGSVVLLFYEGSRTTLGPATDLVLTNIKTDGKHKLVADLVQYAGETFNSIVPFKDKDSSFKVHTQAGVASVHGTTFEVAIEQEGATRFSVSEGEVLVSANNQDMMLSAGQMANVVIDKPLEDPSNQSTKKGKVTVNGVSSQITEKTNGKAAPQADSSALIDEEPTPEPALTETPVPTSTLVVKPSATAEITPTATADITPTATVTATEIVTDCVGADPQPKAQKLADKYGVEYDEIMGLFCQHYGFGEIDQAYSLSEETGTPVEDIFGMRESGMGWGEIKADLLPTKTPKPTKEPKPSKTPKPIKEPKPTKEPKPEKTKKPKKNPKD